MRKAAVRSAMAFGVVVVAVVGVSAIGGVSGSSSSKDSGGAKPAATKSAAKSASARAASGCSNGLTVAGHWTTWQRGYVTAPGCTSTSGSRLTGTVQATYEGNIGGNYWYTRAEIRNRFASATSRPLATNTCNRSGWSGGASSTARSLPCSVNLTAEANRSYTLYGVSCWDARDDDGGESCTSVVKRNF